MKPAKPADPRLLWGFWVLAAAAILLFAFLLRTDLRSVHRLDPADYTEPAPEGFVYECTITPGSGVLTLSGWAMVQDEGPGAVDCRYVLYDPAQDRYYRLPTTMEQSEAAVAATGESGALYAGLYGFALTEQLPAGELELCFAYRSDGHNALIHTGQTTTGGAV